MNSYLDRGSIAQADILDPDSQWRKNCSCLGVFDNLLSGRTDINSEHPAPTYVVMIINGLQDRVHGIHGWRYVIGSRCRKNGTWRQRSGNDKLCTANSGFPSKAQT